MANNDLTPYKITPSSLTYTPSFYVNPRSYVSKISTPGKGYVSNKFRQRQHVRDLGDVILGSWRRGTKQLRHTLQDYGSGHLIGDPILSRMRGLELLIYKNIAEPFVKNGFTSEAAGIAFINSLSSAGYTLDTLANPIKSLIPAAGGGKPGDFLKSLGLIENEYRQTYDWDVNTGNGLADFVVNIIGEFLSDPVNIITLGGKGGIKAIMKASVDELIIPFEVTIKNNLGELATLFPNTVKSLARAAAEDVVSDDSAILERLKALLKNRILTERDTLAKTPDGVQRKQIQTYIKTLEEAYSNIDSRSFLRELNDAYKGFEDPKLIANKQLYNRYKIIRGVVSTAEAADRALFYMATGTSPLGVVGQQLMARALPTAMHHVYKGLAKKMNEVNFSEQQNNKAAAIKTTVDYIFDRNRMMYESDVYSLYEDILKKYNISIERLAEKYASILRSLPKGKRSTTEAEAAFIKYLVETIPELAPILKGATNKEISKLLREIHDYKLKMDPIDITPTKKTRTQNKARLKYKRGRAIMELGQLVDAIKDAGTQLIAVQEEIIPDMRTYKIPGDFFTDPDKYFTDTEDVELKIKYQDLVDEYMRTYKALSETPREIIYEADPEEVAALENIIKIKQQKMQRIKEKEIEIANSKQKRKIERLKEEYYALKPTATKRELEEAEAKLEKILSTPAVSKNKKYYRLHNRLTKIKLELKKMYYDYYAGGESDEAIAARIRANKKATSVSKAMDKKRVIRQEDKSLDENPIVKKAKANAEQATANAEMATPDMVNSIKELIILPDNFDEDNIKFNNELVAKRPALELEVIKLRRSLEIAKTLFANTKTKSKELRTKLEQKIKNIESDLITAEARLNATYEKIRPTNDDIVKTIAEELDNLEIYDGGSVEYNDNDTFTKVLKYICGLDEVKTEDLEEFLLNMDTLQKNISRLYWRMRNPKENVELMEKLSKMPHLVNLIKDLYVTLNTKYVRSKPKFLHAIAVNNSLYYLKMSQLGMLDVLKVELSELYSKDSAWQKVYLDRSSTERKCLNTIISILTASDVESGGPAYAAALREVLGTIDSTEALVKALDSIITPLLDAEGIDPKHLEFMQNIIRDRFYDMLIKAQSVNAIDPERFTHEILYTLLEVYPVLQHTNTELALASYIEKAFIRYKKDLIAISKEYNEVTPGLIFRNETIIQMNWLGANSVELLQVLASYKDVPIESIRIANDLLTRLAGDMTAAEKEIAKNSFEEMVYALQNYRAIGDMQSYEDTIEELITSNAENIANDSLARTITRAWIEIKNINNKLQSVDGHYYMPRIRYNKNTGKYETVIIKNRKTGVEKPYIDKTKNVLGYLTYKELNAAIPAELSFMNMMQYSMATGKLSFKKVIDNTVIDNYHLTPRYFPKLTDEIMYFRFYNLFSAARTWANSLPITKKPNAERLRNNLKLIFKNNPDHLYAPIEGYFDLLTVEELYLWDTFIKKGAFDTDTINLSIQYNELTKYKRYQPTKELALQTLNPLDPLYDIRAKLIKGLRLSAEEWDRYMYDAQDEYIMSYHNLLLEEINKMCKDINSLKNHRGIITNYIDKSVKAMHELEKLFKLGYDTTTVSATLGPLMKTHRAILREYNITGSTKMKEPEVMRLYRHERAQSLALSIRSFNSKQLRTYIDKNTGGMMLYVVRGDKLPWSTADLAEAGLKMVELKDSNGIFMIWRTDSNRTNTPYTYKRLNPIFKEQQDLITSVIRTNRMYYNFEGMDTPDEIFLGDMMNTHEYEFIINSDVVKKQLTAEEDKSTNELVDMFGEDIVTVVDSTGVERKALLNRHDIYSNNFYTEDYSRPNMAFIGDDESAYNTILSYFKSVTMDEDFKPIQKSNRMDKALYTGSTIAIKRVDKRLKMMQLFFNDEFSLDAPLFKQRLTKASDKELSEFFSKGVFTACVLRETKGGKLRVFEIRIRNQKQLANAMELGAIAVPYDIYRSILQNVNDGLLTDKMFQWYNSYIVGTFKTIYLSTVGWLMRNGLDTLIYKNAAATGGVGSIYDNFKYEYRAMKMLEDYNKVIHDTFALADGKTFNVENLQLVLSKLPADKQLEFRLTNRFINSSASAGMAKEFEQFYLARNMKDEIINGGRTFVDALNEDIIHNAFSPVTLINRANDVIEQSGRYGLLLNLLDNGLTMDDAITKVIRTHFDYTVKPTELELLEQVFWFSTFPISNFSFYVNGGLLDNIDLVKSQFDAMELSWNDEENYTWDYIQHSNYLTNMASAGHLRLGSDGKNIVLKTGSSVFDFFKLLYDPIGSAKDRLNPFLSVLLGQEDIKELNPFGSVINRAKQVAEGTSYIPSVYGSLYPKYEYPKRRYSYQSYNPRHYHTYTPKTYISNPKYLRKLSYIFRTNRVYFNRSGSKNYRRWLSHITAHSPVWYNSNFRRRRKFKNRKKRY